MEKNKDFPNIWHAIILLLLLIGLQVIMVFILYDLGIFLPAGDPKFGGVITILSCGIIISMVMSYKNITYKQLFCPSLILSNSLLIKILISTAFVAFGSAILISNISLLIIKLYPMSQADIAIFETLLGGGTISIITVCLLAPFLEEMLFRGIILRSFMHNYSMFYAILLSSLLFAIFHFNIYQFFGAYILGTFLGWLYVVTKSLWPCIFSHALHNVISISYYYFYGGYEESINYANYSSPITMLFAISFVIIGVRKIYIFTSNGQSTTKNTNNII